MPPKIFGKFARKNPDSAGGEGGDNSNSAVVKQEVQPDFDDLSATAFDQQRARAIDATNAAAARDQKLGMQDNSKKPPPKKKTVLAATQPIKKEALDGSGAAAAADDDDDGDDDLLVVTAGLDVKQLVAPISSSTSAPASRRRKPQQSNVTPSKGDATTGMAKTDDDAAPSASASKTSAASTIDARGVKFLSAHRDEISQSRQANQRFFIDSNGGVSIGTTPEMCWLQLPRLAAIDLARAAAATAQQQSAGASGFLHGGGGGAQSNSGATAADHGDELLAGLPQGRVGTLRIHQSGKVSLCIGGTDGRQPVMLDVSVCEDNSDHNARGIGAPSRQLIALMKSLSGDVVEDGVSNNPAAFDLGILGKKLVAMPDFDA